MNKTVYYNNLYDYYEGLLTDKQKMYFEDYYFNNLSLSEMADDYGVSRNAIFKQLKGIEKKLELYEEVLGCYAKKNKVLELIQDNDLKNKIEEIL